MYKGYKFSFNTEKKYSPQKPGADAALSCQMKSM